MFARLDQAGARHSQSPVDAVTGTVMETACSGMNLHRCSVHHKKLTNGATEASLVRGRALRRHPIEPNVATIVSLSLFEIVSLSLFEGDDHED
jgi:hypothetical protein